MYASLFRYLRFERNERENMPLVFREIRGDLFSASSNTSLAHCVSRDMHMSKGIATLFRDKFGQINELKNQSRCSILNE